MSVLNVVEVLKCLLLRALRERRDRLHDWPPAVLIALFPTRFSGQHGGIYVKRSARFNESEMRRRLRRYTDAGTPVRRASGTLPTDPLWLGAFHWKRMVLRVYYPVPNWVKAAQPLSVQASSLFSHQLATDC